MRRALATFAVSVFVGGFTCLVLLSAYVIGKLYLSGHSKEPPWYDTAASAVVFGGALAAFGFMLWLGLRRKRAVPRPSASGEPRQFASGEPRRPER